MIFLELSWMIDGFIPDGVPGIRSVDHPCSAFTPGVPRGTCDSDGHYICQECKHLSYFKTDAGEKAQIAVFEDQQRMRGRL